MKRFIVAVLVPLLGACSNTSTVPSSGSLIPATKLSVSPGYTLPLEKVVYWAGVAAVVYYVADPLAPNWELHEAAFPDNHYRLSLSMKRFYSGGAGEARVVFNRRADELMRKGGFDGYRIVDYSEGIESSVIGAKRVSTGTIQLTRRHADTQVQTGTQVPTVNQGATGVATPARSTSASAENPAS